MRNWRFNIDFSTYPNYAGDDLGVKWTPEKTYAKIWAPTAKIVEFRIYKDGKSGEAFHKTQLQSNGDGTWSTVLLGDYNGKFYTFRINDGEWLEERPDMYARCVGVNGLRGIIYDLQATHPENWEKDTNPPLNKPTDAILYEVNVRDFSMSAKTNIEHKGQYLAFTETGKTTTGEQTKVGVDHLKELGVTHVHLLPVNDFATVNEENPTEKYNWGYDPLHYFALEGSYSSNPYDGTVRIKEFKKLVQSLHQQGIGVVVDVVFNHTYFTKESVFNQTVPGYFYRQKKDGSFSNASGCGNEIASERYMVRKYFLDVLKYWLLEFHLDGFRFDLMGILDIETMQKVQNELRAINPQVLLYGEGWAADYSPMPESNRAVKHNIAQIDQFATFNDDFRDALKGNHGDKRSKGFVSGLNLQEESVKFGIVGAVYHPQLVYDYIESTNEAWAKEPTQCINYVSCHDNYTLWDKLKLSTPKATDEEMRQMVKLAGALILTSQGIPLLHAGIDFCRTKGGDGNSYKSSDKINQLDWSRKPKYADVFAYFQRLIQLRKNHAIFKLNSADVIRERLKFCIQYKMGVVSYCINAEGLTNRYKLAIIIFNGNKIEEELPLLEGSFEIIVKEDTFDENKTGEKVTDTVIVPPVSMMMLVQR